ncbi:MAG TPA: hypothetical protein VKE91_14020 [Blastocatellia bacterium]|nr:hypothetical protein [Blastocatellia bacterium]
MAEPRMNTAPAGFNAETDLPAGFMDFLMPLHSALTPRRRELIERRADCVNCQRERRLKGLRNTARRGASAKS